jgi:uncharacterized protein
MVGFAFWDHLDRKNRNNFLMPRETTAPFQFDASVLSQLACPACLSPFRLGEARLECTGCSRIYPIVDGIPILISPAKTPALIPDP